MIAYTNRDVQILNQHARSMLDQAGQLGQQRETIAGYEWAVGGRDSVPAQRPAPLLE